MSTSATKNITLISGFKKHYVTVNNDEHRKFFAEGSLRELITTLSDVLLSVPEEYRDNATYEFNYDSNYGDSYYPTVEISYTRPQTEDEIASMGKLERVRLEKARDQRRAEFLKLKAEFEPEDK
jgi:hypothetical protein